MIGSFISRPLFWRDGDQFFSGFHCFKSIFEPVWSGGIDSLNGEADSRPWLILISCSQFSSAYVAFQGSCLGKCFWSLPFAVCVSVLGSLNHAGLRGFLCCVWTVGLYLRIRLPTDRQFPCFGECSRNLECLYSSLLLPQFLSHCGGGAIYAISSANWLYHRVLLRLILRWLAPDSSYFASPCRGRLVSSCRLCGGHPSLSLIVVMFWLTVTLVWLFQQQETQSHRRTSFCLCQFIC